MKISPKNVIFHELIGLYVEIVNSSNPYHIGISGKVVDETANMLVIDTSEGRKKIPKKYTVFVFVLPSGEKVKVEGKVLLGGPEERLKKRIRYW